MYKIKYIIAAIVAVITMEACSDLDIKNLNDPDFETAFSNPSDIEGVASGLINNWFKSLNAFGDDDPESPAFALWITADAGTCSWGNFAMRDFGREPRIEYNNTPSYSYASISDDYYSSLYSVLSQCNDILTQTDINGVNVGENNDMVKAVAYFVQGLSLGYLGLVYDKGFIVTQYTDVTQKLEPAPYKAMIDSALVSLDKCINISENITFTIPSTWLPGDTYTNIDFAKLARTFAARLLVYSSRNKTENDNVDWQRVYDYAKNGVTKDFAPLADDAIWYNYYHVYAAYSGWGQVDMYIIHMLDNNMPSTLSSATDYQNLIAMGPATSSDARLGTDFEYLSSCSFKPDRGYYFFSNYRYSRLDDYLTTWTEPMPEIRAAENDYFIAEAEVHLNKLDEAKTVMNNSARHTRGGLPDLPADKDQILSAIHYERMVELFLSGFGVEYFEMRKSDLLQKGSILHFPIPGSQLQVMEMDYYTFGNTTGTAGVDYSNGGWK